MNTYENESTPNRDRVILSHFESRHGPLIERVSRRRSRLNHVLVAQLLIHKFGLAYNVDAQTFQIPQPDKSVRPLKPEVVLKLISDYLHECAQRGSYFPTGELQLPRIKALVEATKIAAAFNPNDGG